jgi:hypothetical protein
MDKILDSPVIALSEKDTLTWRNLCEGTLITGTAGSGKTACSGQNAGKGIISTPGKDDPHRAGGLILTGKAEETENWKRYIDDCGRTKDLIIFNEKSGLCFDPIYYEWSRPGRGSGDIESIIDLFSTLVSIGKKDVGHGHDPFWERGCEQIMRNAIKLQELAGESPSIANIDRTIKSFPTEPNKYLDPAWMDAHHVGQLVNTIKANQNNLTPDQLSDLDFASQYIFDKWPAFDERPRSSLEMTWSSMADRFLYNPLHRVFSSARCDFTPDDTIFRNKIIICDWPMLEYGHETGRTINIILKLIFQRAWLRRKLSESPNPLFLWQDEMQYFVVPKWDNFFQQTCRGSRVAVVALTQNILNLSEQLGEEQPGSKTKSFLGNLAIKIFHQQNETETCNYAADQIGKHWSDVTNWGAGGDSSHTHTHFGGNKQLVHIVEPLAFQKLTKPDGNNPLAEAIVYKSGETFNSTKTKENPKGRNYLSVFFSRAI